MDREQKKQKNPKMKPKIKNWFFAGKHFPEQK
jgi:hypothetical protein